MIGAEGEMQLRSLCRFGPSPTTAHAPLGGSEDPPGGRWDGWRACRARRHVKAAVMYRYFKH